MNQLKKLEAACVETMAYVDHSLPQREQEEEALVAAIGSMIDELTRRDRMLAVQHFRLAGTFRGVGSIRSAPSVRSNNSGPRICS